MCARHSKVVKDRGGGAPCFSCPPFQQAPGLHRPALRHYMVLARSLFLFGLSKGL